MPCSCDWQQVAADIDSAMVRQGAGRGRQARGLLAEDRYAGGVGNAARPAAGTPGRLLCGCGANTSRCDLARPPGPPARRRAKLREERLRNRHVEAHASLRPGARSRLRGWLAPRAARKQRGQSLRSDGDRHRTRSSSSNSPCRCPCVRPGSSRPTSARRSRGERQAGRATQTFVERGDHVVKGAVLAQLDACSAAPAREAQANASSAPLSSRPANAQSGVRSGTGLLAKGAITCRSTRRKTPAARRRPR